MDVEAMALCADSPRSTRLDQTVASLHFRSQAVRKEDTDPFEVVRNVLLKSSPSRSMSLLTPVVESPVLRDCLHEFHAKCSEVQPLREVDAMVGRAISRQLGHISSRLGWAF